MNRLALQIEIEHGANGFTEDVVRPQLEFFSMTLSSIEGFLLSNWDAADTEVSEPEIVKLAEETLAYFLADDEKRAQIVDLFSLLAKNISENIKDPNRRKAFGKTLYGVNDAREIEGYVYSNVDKLVSVVNDIEFLDLIWPLMVEHVHNKAFNRFDKPDVLNVIAQEWFAGVPFHELLEIAHHNNCRLGTGEKPRKVTIDNIVDICEGGFAYDGALLIGALCEFAGTIEQADGEQLIPRLQIFQKRLKYGLPTESTIALYELGFSDRAVSQHLASALNISVIQKKDVVRALRRKRESAIALIREYPAYYGERMKELLK